MNETGLVRVIFWLVFFNILYSTTSFAHGITNLYPPSHTQTYVVIINVCHLTLAAKHTLQELHLVAKLITLTNPQRRVLDEKVIKERCHSF